MDENEIEKLRIAVIEIAQSLETGDVRGLSAHVKKILGPTPHFEGATPPPPRCNCDKCHAIWKGEHNGDDGIN